MLLYRQYRLSQLHRSGRRQISSLGNVCQDDRCWRSINVNPTNPVATSYYPVPGGPSTDIPTQVDRRTFYSPFGSAMLEKPDFVAPSHTAYDKNGVMFDPIMSCVRVGTGDINGCAGPQCNDYRASFGGTSHACPVVAGVAALVISARPDLPG